MRTLKFILTHCARLAGILSILMLMTGSSLYSQVTKTATGTTWETASNWSPSGVPTAADSVVIPSGVNMNINSAAQCGALTIGSATSSITTVTVQTGSLSVTTSSGRSGTLTINPNNVNKAFTLAIGANSLTVDGTRSLSATNTSAITVSTGSVSFTLSSGITWSSGTLTMTGAGNVTFSGPLTQSGGTIQNTTAAGTMNFNGGFTKTAGTFTTLAGESFNFGGNFTVSGTALTLNATSTSTFTASANVTPTVNIIFGHLTVNTGVTLTTVSAAGALTVTGNLALSGTATLAGTETVLLTGGGSSTLDGTGTISAAVTISAAHTVNATADLTITGAITMSTNSGDVTNNGTVTASSINGTAAGATWTNSTNSTLNYSGATLLATGTLTATATGNTINYTGTAAQTVKTANYYNLTVSGTRDANSVTFPNGGTVGIAGAFTPSATFTTGGYVITGNTINYNGTGAQTIEAFNYNNLTVSGAHTTNTITWSTGGTIGVAGTLSITATFTSGSHTTTGSTVDFNDSAAQTIAATSATFQYYHLTLSNAGAKTAGGALTVNGDFTIGGTASFNGGSSQTHNFYGNWIVNTSAATPFAFTTASVINFNTPGTPAATSLSGSTTATIAFNDVNVNNTSGFSVDEDISFQTGTSATLTVAANVTLTPTATAIISGTTGTLTGSGTVKVTRIAATPDFSSQYTINTKTLTNLTVDYNATAAQTVNALNYSTLIINGNRGGATVTLTSGTIGVSAAFSPVATNVSYTTTGNTVDFNGTASETIPAFDYNNLTSSSTGARTLASSGTIGIAGTFTPGTNSYTITGSTIDFNGSGSQTIPAFNYNNLTSSSTGARTLASSGTIGVAATFTTGSNSYTVTGSTVSYNGTGSQSVAGFSYNNLTIANTSSSVTASSGFNVAGTMTVNASATFVPDAAVVINSATTQGTITGSGTVQVTRTAATADYSSQYKFTTNTLTNLTVDYNSTGAQTVSALNYGNLTISGSRGANSVTFLNGGTVGVSGTFSPNASFTTGGYVTTSNTFEFNGSAAQSSPAFTYGYLTINNAAGVSMTGNVTVDNALTLTSGTFALGANTLTLNGDAISGTSSNLSAGSTSSIVFYGTASGLFLPSNITSLNNLTINVSPVSNKVIHQAPLTINGTLTLTDGIFDKLTGSSDTLFISTTGTVVRSGGRVRGSMRQYVPTGNPTLYYPVGGNDLLTPVELQFTNVTTAGYVTVRMVFGDHPSISTSGIDQDLSVNRYYVLTPNGAAFTSYNIRLGYGGTIGDMDAGATPANFIIRRYDGSSWNKTTVGSRADTSTSATGFTAFGQFQVGEQLVKTWDGGAATANWGDATNWNPDGVPTSLEDVGLTGANTIDINVAAVSNSLTLNNSGATLTLKSGNSLSVTGDLSLVSGTFNTEASFPTVSGAVTISGGTVGYTATSGSQTVVVQSYAGLTISGGGTKTLAGSITPSGDLTVSGGTFDLGSYTADRASAGGTFTVANGATLQIGGTNTRPANYNTHSIGATSTIEYNGSNQTIGALNTSQSYGNLTFSGSGTKTFPSGTTGIAGSFTITGVTVDATTNNSTVDFNGNGAQTVPALNYHGLAFSTAGAKTFAAGTTKIRSSFTIGGTASADATTNATTIEYNGSSAQTARAFTYTNLTINNASGVTLAGSITVNGTLTFTSGNVTTSTYTLTISSTGSVSRTSGHIVGNLAKYVSSSAATPTFEIGDANHYDPIDFSFSGITNPGTLTISTTSGDHYQIITSGIDGSKSVNHYWTFTNSGIAFSSYDVTFNYESGDIDGGANPTNFIIARYNGSSWSQPTVGTKTGTSTQATSLTGFGDFQIGEADAGTTKTWDGGAGTSNWGDALNWNPDGVPIASDNINLNGPNTININVAAVCNSITLNNTSLTLTILSGNSLTVSGNFTLTNGTLNTEATFPSVSGTITISGGTVGYTASTGSQTISVQNYYNLTLSNGASKTFASGTFGIAGNFTASVGSVNATTNLTTIDFNGTGNQAVAAIDYYNLTFSNGGTKTFSSGTTRVARDFIVSGGSAVAGSGTTIEFNGTSGTQAVAAIDYNNLTFSNGATRAFAAGTIGIAGNFAVSGGSVTTTSTTINFNGTGTQAVAAINYNHLTFSSTGTRVLSAGTVGVAGDFTISGGSVDARTNSTGVNYNGSGNQNLASFDYYDLTVSNNGGTKTFASGTTRISGHFTVTAGSINTTANTTTLEFDGTGSQNVAAVNYYNLTFSNTGTRTFATGTIGIAGNFSVTGGSTVTTGTTIDFNGTGTQSVAAINYNNLTFSNTGTRTLSSGTTGIAGNFNVTGGSTNTTTNTTTIDFNGAGVQDVAAVNYYNLTFSNGGTKRFASGTSKIANLFTISGGTADATTNSSIIEYNGTSAQVVRAINYQSLTVNNSSGVSLSGDVTVNGTLTFTTGNITTGANTITISQTGAVTRTSGHVIGNFEKYIPTIGPTRTFEVGDATAYTPAVIAFASVSTPNLLTVSTASGDHAQIGTSTIDAAKSANRTWTLTNNGIVFTNYSATFSFVSGDLDPAATPNNFIVGRYSAATWSYPTVGTKTDTSTQATGLTSGQFGDFQVGEEAGLTKTWDGGAATVNWGDAANWNPDGVPISSDNVELTGADSIDVNVAGVTNSLTLNNAGLRLTILSGNSLSVSGNLSVINGMLNTQASFPTVTGSASLSGGEVGYISSGAQTISARTYNKLTLGNGGAKTAGGALTVNDTLRIVGSASFNAGTSLTHTFKGEWVVNTSAATPFTYTTSSTVNFNAPTVAAARSISGTTSATIAFNTVNVNNTSGFSVNLNISASGTLTVANTVVLTPGASNIISGTGTLTGSGTVQVTRTAATADFSSQYAITNKTLTNLTVDYAAAGQSLSNTTYGGLKISGSITGASNTATVGSAFTVTGTFTPTSGTVTMNNGSSIVNSGTLTFTNLTIANSATVSTSSSFSIAGTLTVGTSATFSPSSGTITMTGTGWSITNSGTLLSFDGLTIATTPSAQSSASYTVKNALSVNIGVTLSPSGGTITLSNGASIVNSGALIFSGLTIASSATVTTSSSFSVGGTLTVGTSANFSPSSGTITMNNASSVANSGTLAFRNVTIAASATVTASGSITVVNTLTIGASATFTPSGTVTVNGDVSNAGSQTGTILLSGGSAAHAISGAGPFTNLELNDSQGASLSANVTINGTLTLTLGKITTGANKVTISSSGSVSRTSGYVAGNLEKDVPNGSSLSRTFEIGDALNYTPVSMTFASVTGGGGLLTVSTTSSDHVNIGTSNIDPTSSANRYWTLSGSLNFTTVDITFNFVSGDVDAGADPLQFIVGEYSAATWSYPTVGTKTSTSTQVTGVTALGDFQLGQQFGGTFTSTATGGTWSSTTTWSGGQVPSLSADVIIATTGSNAVTIDANTANLHTVTINSGAILQGGGLYTLSFGADGGTDFTNDGTFTANGVTVKLNKNSQWAGSGTFSLKNIDFNTKTLTIAFASANTISLAGTGDPFVNPGTLTPGTNATFEYSGTSAQEISSSSGINFHHVLITNSNTVTLQKNLTASNLTGNLTITSGGVVNTSNGSTAFSVTGTSGATLTVGASSTLNLGGAGVAASAFPTGFTTVSIDPASTIQYSNNSSASQTVSAAPSYGNILFSGGGTKSVGSGSLTVAGDWTNNSTGGSLDAGTSTVTLTGTSKSIGGTATTTFATLNVDGTYTNNATNAVNIALGGTGTLTQGTSAALNLNFSGSVGLTNLVASASGNTINYQYAGAQTVKALDYTNLTLSGSGTKTLPASSTIRVSGIFTITGVTVDPTTSTVEYNGSADQTVAATSYYNLTFANAGTKFFPNGTTQIAGSLAITGSASANTLTNTSTVEFNGTSAQTINGLTYYNLTLSNSGVKTFTTATTTNANLTINTGVSAVVDPSVVLQVNGDFNLYGSITNNGTVNVGN